MRLYHGTSTEHLPSILTGGLLPRGTRGAPGNFTGLIESNRDLVYLTKANPVFYAIKAAIEPYSPVIIRVEVCEESLYPDEDYLATLAAKSKGLTRIAVPNFFDPRRHQERWKQSLDFLGNVTAPKVTPDAILDYRVLPTDDWNLLLTLGADSVPTVRKHLLCGRWQQRVVDAF